MASKLVGSLFPTHQLPPPLEGVGGCQKNYIKIPNHPGHISYDDHLTRSDLTSYQKTRGPIKASLVLFYFGLAELLQHDTLLLGAIVLIGMKYEL